MPARAFPGAPNAIPELRIGPRGVHYPMNGLTKSGAGALAGIAGAVAMNMAHEITRRVLPEAPRLDVVGMRALARISSAAGVAPPARLREATFAADLAANSLYFSLVGIASARRALPLGAFLGGAAGVGSVLLPPPMKLGAGEVNRTRTTEALTVGLYLAGGLVAALAYRALVREC